MKKVISLLMMIFLLSLLSACTPVDGTATTEEGAADEAFVAMLLPENVNPRWESQDARFFKEAMAEISPETSIPSPLLVDESHYRPV